MGRQEDASELFRSIVDIVEGGFRKRVFGQEQDERGKGKGEMVDDVDAIIPFQGTLVNKVICSDCKTVSISKEPFVRSEERRVGKEGRSRRSPYN